MLLPRTVVADAEWLAAQDVEEWLTASELTVFGAWRSEVRQSEWLAGRLAAKRLLWKEHSFAPLSWAVGRDGVAPALAGLALPNTVLSVSHSGGFGAATLSDTRTEGSAGIDIQRIRPVHPGLCARVFTPGERGQIAALFGSENSTEGMLLVWSLKEAAIKARRLPWMHSLRSIQVYISAPGFAEVQMEDEPPMTACYARLGDWWLARAVKITHPVSSLADPPETGG